MAGTDYSTYLKIPDLLTLQVPLTPGADDELLFIVVHQSYELWFKVMVDELRKAVSALGVAEPWNAIAPLRRVVATERLLLEHLRVLETMSPEAFLAFRDPLDPASGFQSFQFRALEFLSGGGKREMLEFSLFTDDVKEWLRGVASEVTLWQAFAGAVSELTDHNEVNVTALVALYRDHRSAERAALHTVAELLMDHDEFIAMWRHQHMLMAGREIGNRTGTGGSAGMSYLATTLNLRLYPLLWEVRSAL